MALSVSWLKVLTREQCFDQEEVTAFVKDQWGAGNGPLLVNTPCSRLDVATCFNVPAFVDVICQSHINQSDISPNLFDLFKKPIKNGNESARGEKKGENKNIISRRLIPKCPPVRNKMVLSSAQTLACKHLNCFISFMHVFFFLNLLLLFIFFKAILSQVFYQSKLVCLLFIKLSLYAGTWNLQFSIVVNLM